MAEIKDKVVTVESLSALHDYNKEAYMNKVNPVSNGNYHHNGSAWFTNDIYIGDKSINNALTKVKSVEEGGTGATSAADALVNLGLTATATELNYMDGVTSNVQIQLDGKAASSHNQSANTITSGTLNENRLPTISISKGGTGATTATQACANLGAATVLLGESIPSGANLSDYTTVGTYRSSSAEISATLDDTPWTETGFKLEVFNTTTANQIMQEIKCNSASARVFRRIATRDSSTGDWFFNVWYEVLQVVSDEPYVPVNRGGTGANGKLSAASNLSILTAANIAGSDYDIPSGANLDTYKEAGVYRSGTKEISASLKNAPPVTSAGFRLEVKHTTSEQGIMQTAIYNNTTPTIYVRISSAADGTFGDWHKLNFTSA